MTDESLWPARNVAEYAYCPRLFYYMQVEGVFLPSDDTEKGRAVHRRVDKPSVTPRRLDEDVTDTERPTAARSLTLTSNKLRLTATLDLAEITGNVAVPVEYRKGRPRRKTMAPPPDEPDDSETPGLSTAEPWPTDRVQVGLQAILLEEAGYEVKEAVLYYATEKQRVTVQITDEIRKEAMDTLGAAAECADGERPPPLVNDPRCPRCSLQPICLPDEVNHQRFAKDGDTTPRKIWPPRDDGIQVIAQSQGARVGINGQQLRVKDRNGITLKNLALANVESLSLVGSVQISTQALHALAQRNIPVGFLSAAGRMVAMVDPLDSVSAKIRTAQVLRFESSEKCLALARALVVAKIANQRTLLMRNHASLPKSVLRDMGRERTRAAKARTIESLRGHEGQAAALYFAHFSGMFQGPLASEFDANGRQRRPPPDPINACLSFAYTMLTHECVTACRLARLEPTVGAFHSTRPGRPALALDLMEPFRPLIADSVAVSAFNRGELVMGHFLRTTAGCAMTAAGRSAFFDVYGRRMSTEVTHPVFEYRLSYRRMLVLHARMVAAWLLDDIPNLDFLTTR